MNLEMDITVNSKHGLHVRPCTSLVKICMSDPSVTVKIKNVSEDSDYVDGKSMMQVSSLRAAYGQVLHFVFIGDKPQGLADRVEDFFSSLD